MGLDDWSYGAIGQAALAPFVSLAARGWRLFPCHPRDKTPLVHDWPHMATTDLGQMRAWQAQYPRCNWGIATGRTSGIWVLDVDGPSGEASLLGLTERHGKLPSTFTVRTGKGLHLYFGWPVKHDLRNSAGRLGEGLDSRAEGGYVLAPGSIHPSGAVYAVLDPTAPVAEAPPWLVQLAASPLPNSLQVAAGDRIPQGKGEPAKFALAGKLMRAGATRDEVLAAVLARDARCCHQLGRDECARKVDEWFARYRRGEPLAVQRCADLLTLADVQAHDVDWLWRPYLPGGMLAMLSGDPAAGKTFIALAIAAALTTGYVPSSAETCEPARVLYLTVENDAACVVRPRFDAMGGDPTRLYLLRGYVTGDGDSAEHGSIWLTDMSPLRDALDKTHARLMVVDPIQSYLGAGVDAPRANETRPVLDGPARLAEEYRCCVLLLRHLGKAPTGRAIHRGLGSIDLTGAVRSEMLAGSSPADPQQRAMVQIKNNLGAYGPALGYVIDGAGRFRWTGESALTRSDILAPEPVRQETARDDAAAWLRTFLAGGPRTAKEVERAARAEGMSWATVRRAKQDAGAESSKPTFGGPWVWQLTEDARPGAEDAEDAQHTVLSTLAHDEHLGSPDREKGEL